VIALLVASCAALLALSVWVLRLRIAHEAARRDAADAAERHLNVIEAIGDGLYIVDERLRITHANDVAETLLRATADRLVGRKLDDVVDPLGSDLVPEIRLARRTGKVVERLCAFAATQRWIEIRIKPATHETLVSLRDVSEGMRTAAQMLQNDQRLRLVTGTVDAVLWTTDRAANFTSIRGGALGDLALSAEELHGAPCDALLGRNVLADVFEGTPVRAETARGKHWLRHHVEPLHDRSGAVVGAVGVSLDVTELKQAEQQLFDVAHRDRLTGLPNRLSVEARIEATIVDAQRDGRSFALLFVDLDRFKTINDTLGHGLGDDVLREVASRLQDALRAGDVIARPGGDEFIILLPQIAFRGEIESVAQRVVRVLGQPVMVRGRELFVNASVGAAIFPEHGADAEALVAHADAAMYRAKARGGNRYALFDDAMALAASERLELENDLRGAVERDELRLLYQPVVDVKTRRIVGCEALVRWQHRTRGVVAPAAFIPIAEETGLIVPVDRWVLREACATAARMRASRPEFRVAINLSPRDLREPDLTDVVAALLAEHGLSADALAIEVTEQVALDDTVLPALRRLCTMGVHVALDDFGVGYSSLAFLKRLPITALKIDRAFLRDVVEDAYDQAIVGSIVTIAKALGLHVTAEGLETEDQIAFVAALGCDAAQGYWFGTPMPYEALDALVRAPALRPLEARAVRAG
jgi:diguanylate cyclase (GGDEF)-like protein